MLAHLKYRKTRTTTSGGGFAAASSADGSDAYHPDAAYKQGTVDAITNLASTTAHNRDSVATITATVTTLTTLTTKLTATNTKLIKALMETTKLTATVGKLRCMTPKPRVGGAQNTNRHYCWSCGYLCTYNSLELRTTKDGRNIYAKATDSKGGSTHNNPS